MNVVVATEVVNNMKFFSSFIDVAAADVLLNHETRRCPQLNVGIPALVSISFYVQLISFTKQPYDFFSSLIVAMNLVGVNVSVSRVIFPKELDSGKLFEPNNARER